MFARRWWKGKDALAAPALSLALQGGGAHGAYTWGVLDRLLEDDWRLDGISGTSAGAMNAVALADGWVRRCRGRGRAWQASGRRWPTRRPSSSTCSIA
jgi:NTE family protein